MGDFYVYRYTDPSRNEVIYIGKGRNKRARQHLMGLEKSKKRHPFIQRLQKMLKNGVSPIIDFVCTNVDEELAFLVEAEAIEKYGRKDLEKGTLLNLSDGGEGSSGYRLTSEQRQKVKTKVLASWKNDDRRKQTSERLKAAFEAGIGPRKMKPCTIDGKTVFPSWKAMKEALGQGKNGTRHPNFHYLSEASQILPQVDAMADNAMITSA